MTSGGFSPAAGQAGEGADISIDDVESGLGARGLRGFLSDPELEALTETAEPYDPGSEVFLEDAEEDEPPLSQHYWPDLSDTSIPQMDLGWPDSASYRGVTRTAVYTQPPLEGHTHIKEVVRKMIAQAQKVIAVVMDMFTDVDIFRDLLDAGFKRKVSVYILLEHNTLPHFRSMCERADMHAGHLKNLRVRCTDGREFHTRSCKRVRGRMGHRFMFVDGDKAVSGSYGFTWMASRLDKNLITVVTGQAVDAFDRLFRVLYASSSFVDLRQVATEPEPELEPVPQVATVQASPADIARKLYSPKYALVALSNPSPTPSASPKETQNPEDDPKSPESKKRRRRKANQEAAQEAPPLHPGLIDLEKASLISYLPIWPEPDPPSDVIGFINVRDISKPTQVHLQRSEMFEKSQAIRFSSPVSMPKEILPDVAKPRQFSVNPMEKNKRQPAQDKSKAKESQAAQLNAGVGDIKSKAEAPGQKTPASGPKCDSNKDTMKALNTENKLHSNTPKNQEAGHNTTPQLNAHTPRQSSGKAPPPDARRPLQTVTTLAGFKTETSLNTHRPVVVRTNTLSESSSKHTSHLQRNADTEPHTQTKKVLPDKDSHTQPQKIPTSPTSASPTSVSEKNHISISNSTTPGSPLSFIPSSPPIPHLISSPTALNPPLPPSSASPSLTSTPPVPKPRTVQLVMTGVVGDSGKLPEFSVVRKSETNTGSLVVRNEPTVAKEGQPSPEKVPETVPDLHNNNGSQTLAQKDSQNKEEAPQQNQIGTTQEVKNEEEAGGCDDRAGMLLVAGNNLDAKSDVLITGTLKEEGGNIQELIPKDVDVKTLMSVDCKLTPQVDCVATVETEIKAPEKKALPGCEFSEVTNEKTDLSKAHQAPQRISHSELTPQDTAVLDTVDSLIAPTHSPVPSTHVPKDSAGDGTHTSAADTKGQQGYPSITPAHGTDSKPNTAKQNTHGTFQEQTPTARGSTHTPERPLRLQLTEVNVPDLRSPTPEKESWLLAALTRTPTPDGNHSCTPTSDSRTPDFRTPTPDGYFSARTDSALSTNSEEYYECSGSPLNEAVLDRAASRKHGTIEDHVSFTLTNTPNATGITTSPAYINYNSCEATIGATDRNTSSSETQSVSGPAKVSSSSSLAEKKEVEEKENGNEENGRKVDEKGTSLVESRTEGDYQGSERKGSEEAKRTAEHFNQSVDSTETKEINQEAQPPKRKKVLNQSAAETPAELTNERTENRLSTGDPQPTNATSEVKRPDKEKTVDKAALGPSSVERRDKPQPTREADGQKLLRTPSKSPRAQQQGSGSSSPSRPARPARPLSANLAPGPLPSGGRQLNQTESKVLHGSFQVLDNASSPRRPPTRPPPPATAGAVGSAAGRKQAEVSRDRQSLLTRQPLSAQGRTRAGQPQNQHSYPKPPASFLHTHSNREQQLHHHSQNQTAAPREAHWQEEGRTPFSFTFSRLYNLKGLKDRMGKLPSQSKRGSASSPGQGRKSTS